MKKEIFVLVLALQTTAFAMSVDEYLIEVAKKNKNINSYNLEIEAANNKRDGEDLNLSPTLTASYSESRDKSQPSQLGTSRDVNNYKVGLSKKFSTGTSISLTGEASKFLFKNPLIPFPSDYSNGGLGFGLQQSLGKDFFGRTTRLRKTRDEQVFKIEAYMNELRKRAELIKVESDYWDYLVALENLKLKKANLERTQKLERWTASRLSNGISDKTDLLQIQALLGLRELELATAEDELELQAVKLRENLGLTTAENLPELTSAIVENRPYMADLMKQNKVVKIETYISSLDAGLKQYSAEELRDAIRPELTLVGNYNTSSYNTDFSNALSHISDTDFPVTFIGLSFLWRFGTEASNWQIVASKKEALAARLRSEQSDIEGQNAWATQKRKYELTKKNVLRLEKIAQLQSERTKQEQIKFLKGRSVTLNVVNAETESAEAAVNYLKGKSGLRKLEAASLLFISVSE